jgi:sigma-B regulation protein RsbQ
MSAAIRNNVTVSGVAHGQPIVFLHGFGCDQSMWRYVSPAFEEDHRVVLLDHVGAGGSEISGYRRSQYSDLNAYARDVLEVCEELDLREVVLVGHSVSSMIGILAANLEPERFAALVLVGPSPRYLDDDGYVGGFSREDIDGLLETMDNDYLGWSSTMAPAIMGNADRPELGEELRLSFCRTDPDIARDFASVTFLSDNRADLPQLRVRSVILQCADDIIASRTVGEYVHRELPGSEFVMLEATGHCPHVSAPEQTTAAIRVPVTRWACRLPRSSARACNPPSRSFTRTRPAATCRCCWTARWSRPTGRSYGRRATRPTHCWGGAWKTC